MKPFFKHGGAIILLLGIFALAAFLPLEWVERQNLCFIRNLVGLECPGCGLTRAFLYLFQGEIRSSLQMNALAPVLVLWFGIYLMQHLIAWVRGSRPRWYTPQGSQWIGRAFGVLFFGQWLWKILPGMVS
ncbi:MAG: DUF2752 domain-containing protein [bacterium]|nr:DUF2752 domain-containing protein [bacterium]